jgi:4'-phosphopantetheinyl transferase
MWTTIPETIDTKDLISNLNILDPNEIQVYNNYRVESKRLEFFTGRLLLKSIIGELLQAPPDKLVFRKDLNGKPYLLNDISSSKVHFNLTHSHMLVACAISRENSIGIDVEHMGSNYVDLAPFVCSEIELNFINRLEDSRARNEAFFLLWTRKEALLKAHGVGLSVPPQSVDVPLDPGWFVSSDYKYMSTKIMEDYQLSVVEIMTSTAESMCQCESLDMQEVDFYALCNRHNVC